MRRVILVVLIAALLQGCGPTVAEQQLAQAKQERDTAEALWHECLVDSKCPPERSAKLTQQLEYAEMRYEHADAMNRENEARAFQAAARMNAQTQANLNTTYQQQQEFNNQIELQRLQSQVNQLQMQQQPGYLH